jgi:Domain of unknown function DUF29
MSLAKDKPYFSQPSDYEDDVYAWAFEQAQLLRLGRFSELDVANVIEEIESLGREIELQLGFHYRDLIAALLEWQYARPVNVAELEKTILDARIGIQEEERDSKSLRDAAKRLIAQTYPSAARLAVVATGLPRETFPIECPYGVALLRDLDAMPPEGLP